MLHMKYMFMDGLCYRLVVQWSTLFSLLWGPTNQRVFCWDAKVPLPVTPEHIPNT